jgi:hypothetical protein
MSIIKLAPKDDSYQVEVVELLEKLLAAAKLGRIRSLMYTCEQTGEASVTIGGTQMQDRYKVIGLLDHQKYLIHCSLSDDMVDSDLLEGS